jgi:hypothetical protein
MAMHASTPAITSWKSIPPESPITACANAWLVDRAVEPSGRTHGAPAYLPGSSREEFSNVNVRRSPGAY